MNFIEEHIRAATRAAGNTVSPDSVPPLELPAEHPRADGWRRRWLVPVAAAAAVVVLIAITAVTVRQVTRTPTPVPSIAPAATAPGPMLPGPSLASYVSAGLIPPYFVSVAFTGEPTESPAVAVVHDTVSGETLATIKPSIRGGTIRAVSAAGDDRTFLLDEQTWAKFLPHVAVTEYAGPHTFYLLRLSSAGRVSSLTRLRVTVPATQVLAAFALSPDAQRLALVVQARKHSQGRTDLEVVTLSTGSTRVWAAASGFFRSGAGDSRGLSWTADGRELAFEWQPNNVGQWPGVEARLLNLTSADGDLMAASRRIIATTRQFTPSGSTFQVADAENEPVVTPDGSAIVTNTVYFQVKTKESGQATNGRYGFAEYSTRTGKLVRILGYWKIKPAGYFFTQVLWSSPSGRVLIGVIPDGRIGVINGNEFTPLNMPPVPSVVMDIGLGAQAGAW
jgi:hypothetical protein